MEKFIIKTEKGSEIEMELGQEIVLTLIDKETKEEKRVIISIKEK